MAILTKYGKTKKYDQPLFIAPQSTEEVFSVKAIDESGIYVLNNGKYSKGTFGTYSGCLIGVFICNSIAACVGMDFNASDNIFYNNVVSPGSNGITSDCGKTYSQYLCIPFGKAAIIK